MAKIIMPQLEAALSPYHNSEDLADFIKIFGKEVDLTEEIARDTCHKISWEDSIAPVLLNDTNYFKYKKIQSCINKGIDCMVENLYKLIPDNSMYLSTDVCMNLSSDIYKLQDEMERAADAAMAAAFARLYNEQQAGRV